MSELYDDYAPSYTYKCSNCGKTINREQKATTKTVFCCQQCVGYYNSKNKKGPMPSHVKKKISEGIIKWYNERKNI